MWAEIHHIHEYHFSNAFIAGFFSGVAYRGPVFAAVKRRSIPLRPEDQTVLH